MNYERMWKRLHERAGVIYSVDGPDYFPLIAEIERWEAGMSLTHFRVDSGPVWDAACGLTRPGLDGTYHVPDVTCPACRAWIRKQVGT